MSPGFSPVFVASLVHTLPSEFPAFIILLEVGGEVELPVGEGTSRDVTVTALWGKSGREEEMRTLISKPVDKAVPEKIH